MADNAMTVTIRPARGHRDAAEVADMAREFVAWLRQRYPERAGQIDAYLKAQRFEEQIGEVLTHYGPPRGECLLAELGGAPVGILMMKDLGDGVCEMNRMFVRDAARGHGAGRALVTALIGVARETGFHTMVLGALPRHHEALSLYRSAGFVGDDDSARAIADPDIVHMRLAL